MAALREEMGIEGEMLRVLREARVRAGGGAGLAAGRKDGPAWAVSLLSLSLILSLTEKN